MTAELDKARTKMNVIRSDQRARQDALNHKQYMEQRSIRKANQMVLRKTGGNTGQASGTIAAAKHPLYGTITNPDQVKQTVWHYNAKLAAPVVAPHTAEDFPWQRPPGGEPPVDEFELLSRGKESSLAHRLTRSVFDARLRMAANNKAAGSDMFTNDLLKHLPDSHKDMLFSFYQLCWATGRTPAEWKHSETVSFHKERGGGGPRQLPSHSPPSDNLQAVDEHHHAGSARLCRGGGHARQRP